MDESIAFDYESLTVQSDVFYSDKIANVAIKNNIIFTIKKIILWKMHEH